MSRQTNGQVLDDILAIVEHLQIEQSATLALVTRLERQMTAANADQAKLDADVAGLGDVLTNIEAEIAALKAQPGAESLDFSGLDSVLARGVGDETPAPAPDPAPATPAEQAPESPAV